jgi:hypothetical protein
MALMTNIIFQQQQIFHFTLSLLYSVPFFCDVTKRHNIPAPLLKVAHCFHTLKPKNQEKCILPFLFQQSYHSTKQYRQIFFPFPFIGKREVFSPLPALKP